MPLQHILGPLLEKNKKQIEAELEAEREAKAKRRSEQRPMQGSYLEDPRATFARRAFPEAIEQQSSNELQEAQGYNSDRGWYNRVTGARAYPEPARPQTKSYLTQIANPATEQQKAEAMSSYVDALGALPKAVGMSPGGATRFQSSALGQLRSGGDVASMIEGERIAARAAPEKPKRGVIDLPKTGPVGIDEATGQAIDRRGKKLGYLDQRAIVTRYGDVPLRGTERAARDVVMQDTDKFAQSYLEQTYGKHVKEVEDNNGKFPAGYFKGMKPEEKENIKKGVQELMKRRKGKEPLT